MYKLIRAVLFSAAIAACMFGRAVSAASAESCAVAVSSSASSAILYEPTSGTVLFEQNAHIKRPMASTTKLMTALITAESLPLDRVVTVRAEAIAVEGSSLGLAVGDRVTVKDLLCGLLLVSGNDAANVLALETAPSLEAYAARMNERAAAIGMANSCFVTPSGLDADGHGASAYDMALLAAEVLKHDTLAAICAMPTAEITISDRAVTLQNHNRLLRELEGCVGMKTGYTSQSGRCLVSAATRDGVTLIAVTLDCADDWREHRTLLEEGFSCVERTSVSMPVLPRVTVFGGETSSVALTGTLPSFLRFCAEEEPRLVIRTVPYVWAPLEAGEPLGTVEIRVGNRLAAAVPLCAASSSVARECPSLSVRFWALFSALFCNMLSG